MVYITIIEGMYIVTPSFITKIEPLLDLDLAIRPDEPYLKKISIETMMAYAGTCGGLTRTWEDERKEDEDNAVFRWQNFIIDVPKKGNDPNYSRKVANFCKAMAKYHKANPFKEEKTEFKILVELIRDESNRIGRTVP